MLIAQYQGTSWVSWIIRFITRSRYSHSAFLFDERTEAAAINIIKAGEDLGQIVHICKGSVVESWYPDGVRNVSSLSEDHNAGTIVDIFELVEPLSLTEEQALLMALKEEIGCPYDLISVLRFVTKRPGNLDKAWFCSELVFEMLQRVLRALFKMTVAWEVTPDWVARSPVLRYLRTEVTV